MNVEDIKIGDRVEIIQDQVTKDGVKEFAYKVEVTNVAPDAILGNYTPASVGILLPGCWFRHEIKSVEALTKGTVV